MHVACLYSTSQADLATHPTNREFDHSMAAISAEVGLSLVFGLPGLDQHRFGTRQTAATLKYRSVA